MNSRAVPLISYLQICAPNVLSYTSYIEQKQQRNQSGSFLNFQVATLKSRRPNEVINAFMADDRGTVVVYNDDPLDTAFFWDLETREFLFEVKRKGKYKSLTLTHASFTPNGKYFVVSMRKTDETDYIRHPCVWNIQESTFTNSYVFLVLVLSKSFNPFLSHFVYSVVLAFYYSHLLGSIIFATSASLGFHPGGN